MIVNIRVLGFSPADAPEVAEGYGHVSVSCAPLGQMPPLGPEGALSADLDAHDVDGRLLTAIPLGEVTMVDGDLLW